MFKLLSLVTVSFLVSNASYAACGMNGSVAEKIQSCSQEPNAKILYLVLVSKDDLQNEIYKDTLTGLFWSAPLANKVNYADAKTTCANFDGLNKSTWKIPSVSDFSSRALIGSLPRMNDYYWTSTIVPDGRAGPHVESDRDYQFIVDGNHTSVTAIMLRNYTGIAVRCVSL